MHRRVVPPLLRLLLPLLTVSLFPPCSRAFFPWPPNYPSAVNLTLAFDDRPHHVSPVRRYHFPITNSPSFHQYKQPSEPSVSLISCLPKTLTLHTPSSSTYTHLLSRAFISRLTPTVLPYSLSKPSIFHTLSPPLLIVLPRSTSDLSHIMRCAHIHSMRVCARSGGHSYLANTHCAGILIDLQRMRLMRLHGNQLIVGAGAILGEVGLFLAKRRKWFPMGVCPAVGIAGFLLGGGYSPYAARLGIDVACDTVKSITIVDRFGKVATASRGVAHGHATATATSRERVSNESLLWASCGGGGAQFGIVTSFTMTVFPMGRANQVAVRQQQQARRQPNTNRTNNKSTTAYTGPFAGGVVNFRIMWPTNVSHLVLAHWASSYHTPSTSSPKLSSSVWARAELYPSPHESGVYIYGMCFSSGSPSSCLARLHNLFPTLMTLPGYRVLHMQHAASLLHAHATLGPHGQWGRHAASIRPIARAFTGTESGRFTMTGQGDEQMTMSAFVSKRPSTRTWKRFVRFCHNMPGLNSIPWAVCMLSPMMPKIKGDVQWKRQRDDRRRARAFAFGHALFLTDFIIGGGSETHKRKAYYDMKNIWDGLRDGVYVNYPEALLTSGKGAKARNKNDQAYPRLYWGKHLHRLMRIKKQWDPHNFFSPLQPIPTPPTPGA